MTKYVCPICGNVELRKGFPSETGHIEGWCLHGDYIVRMKIL